MSHGVDLDDMFDPLSLALFFAINKSAFEKALVSPYELPETVRLSISVIANVYISIMIDLCTFAMFD